VHPALSIDRFMGLHLIVPVATHHGVATRANLSLDAGGTVSPVEASIIFTSR